MIKYFLSFLQRRLLLKKIFIFAPAVKDKRQKGKELLSFILKHAQMAKLVDALVSGTSVSNDVQVRVLFWAPPTAQSAE